MNDIIRRLKALKKSWLNIENMPKDLTMLGLPGKDSRYIEDAIDELAVIASKLMFVPPEDLVMIKLSSETYLKSLEAFFSKEISGHPSMQMLTFVTLLQQMQISLREAVAQKIGASQQGSSQINSI